MAHASKRLPFWRMQVPDVWDREVVMWRDAEWWRLTWRMRIRNPLYSWLIARGWLLLEEGGHYREAVFAPLTWSHWFGWHNQERRRWLHGEISIVDWRTARSFRNAEWHKFYTQRHPEA